MHNNDILKNFDQWVTLAKTDPAAFELMRQRLIHQTIDKVPEDRQHRLKQLQWEIDGMRTRSSNALSAVIKMQSRIFKLLNKQQNHCQALHTRKHEQPAQSRSSKRTAKILVMPPQTTQE